MEVVDHDQQRLVACSVLERYSDAFQHLEPTVEQPAQRHELVAAHDHGVGRGQGAQQGSPRGDPVQFVGDSGRHHEAAFGREIAGLGQEPGLTDSRRALDHRHSALTLVGLGDQALQLGEFALAPPHAPGAGRRADGRRRSLRSRLLFDVHARPPLPDANKS